LDQADLGNALADVFNSADLAELVAPTTSSDPEAARKLVDEDQAAAAVDVGCRRGHLGSLLGHQVAEVVHPLAREQCRALLGGDPDVVVACVGGGSNAMGIFSGFVDGAAALIGVEPAGGAAVGRGVPGVVHGMKSYLMQDEYGQVLEAHSISAGLDYPGVGPEHSYLASIGRGTYVAVDDDEVIEAFQLLSRTEGIIPALEPAHAIAWVVREAASLAGKTVLVNLSGRGDKDVAQMMELLHP